MPTTGTIVPGVRQTDGLRVRHVDSSTDGATTVLVTSPSAREAVRRPPDLAALADAPRVIAIELPGFGRSERRVDLLAPSAMTELLIEAAGSLTLTLRTS